MLFKIAAYKGCVKKVAAVRSVFSGQVIKRSVCFRHFSRSEELVLSKNTS